MEIATTKFSGVHFSELHYRIRSIARSTESRGRPFGRPEMRSQRIFEQGRRIRSYRADLQVLIEAPEGTLAVTAIIWLDKGAQSADFVPIGTHQGFRHRGLGTALPYG